MPQLLYPQGGLWYPMNRGPVRVPDSVDVLEKRKIGCPCWDLKPRSCSPQFGNCANSKQSQNKIPTNGSKT
jgi:hypothetical protein